MTDHWHWILIVDGFSHEQDGTVLETFPARDPGMFHCEPTSQFAANSAESKAIQARAQGIAEELESLGVPGFEQILEAWNNLLS